MLFRTFTLTTLLAAAAIAVSAQTPVAADRDVVFFNRAVTMSAIGPDGVPDQVLQRARAALNLSEVQVTAVKTLLNMRTQSTQQIFQEMEAAQTRLHDLTQQSNPNATEVGTAFLAAQTAQERFRAAADKFRTDFQALLNADQRSLLARLNTASEQIEALRILGALDTPGPEFPMPFTQFAPAGAFAMPGVPGKPVGGVGGGMRIQLRGPVNQ